MSLFKIFERSVVCQIAWRHSWFVEFNSSDQDYVCFKLKIVGREDAQAKFGTVDLLCIICGGSLCGVSPLHLFLYQFIQLKETKWR
jgi:hypothetical protein